MTKCDDCNNRLFCEATLWGLLTRKWLRKRVPCGKLLILYIKESE